MNLLSPVGRWLACVPASRARQLLDNGAVVEEKRGGKIHSIRVKELREQAKKSTPLSPASYLGTRYVFLESIRDSDGQVVGRTFRHKLLNDEGRVPPEVERCDRDLIATPFADVCTARRPPLD